MIKKLNSNLINQIAAGEVVDDPSSIIKELIENSIDANSTTIELILFESGINKIIVNDDGDGIPKDELSKAFERFATSKINNLDDLNDISTLGFRGEALPSIASISDISVNSFCKSLILISSSSRTTGYCPVPVVGDLRVGGLSGNPGAVTLKHSSLNINKVSKTFNLKTGVIEFRTGWVKTRGVDEQTTRCLKKGLFGGQKPDTIEPEDISVFDINMLKTYQTKNLIMVLKSLMLKDQ